MANLIQATVYQIDGAPQQPSFITLDFQTTNLVIKEASINEIPQVQSVIYYYNVVNNQQSVQQFFVGEDVPTLVAAANIGGTSQVQVTVLEINSDPQVPGGVQYSFPADEILVGQSVNATTGVNAYVQFKGVKYFVSETEATILAAANAGSGGGGVTSTLVLNRSSTSTQNPTGTDSALTVRYGGFFATTDVTISPTGTVTFNQAGTYIVNIFTNASRATSTAGYVFLQFRTLLNGSPILNTKAVFLNNINQSTPYETTFVLQAGATDTFQMEIMRNSAGLDDGGLYAFSASAGWANIPSASIRIWKLQ